MISWKHLFYVVSITLWILSLAELCVISFSTFLPLLLCSSCSCLFTLLAKNFLPQSLSSSSAEGPGAPAMHAWSDCLLQASAHMLSRSTLMALVMPFGNPSLSPCFTAFVCVVYSLISLRVNWRAAPWSPSLSCLPLGWQSSYLLGKLMLDPNYILVQLLILCLRFLIHAVLITCLATLRRALLNSSGSHSSMPLEVGTIKC